MQYLKPLMDQNFLEYASYVIKDRAIPDIEDGLKPVQRRILHTMMKMDDGKFNKVANVIGETMKLHPHGDASIGSALVVLANKDLFIEKQGNFGNLLTGDPASAARYIEARLTPLAKEVLFNPELTETVDSYDGRNQEPITLPCKIPSTLLLGAEGIAVGMSTRILPHNFQEVLDAQIAYLQNKPFELYPDFHSGGLMDISEYEQGNGKVKIRAKIELVDDKTLLIRELPFGVTTETIIQSIQDAVNKNKFKLSSINDFTTDQVEIELKAPRGTSAEDLIKPLYAFTHCEVSISVNLLVIRRNQPEQLSVNEILTHNTDRLMEILQKELELALEKAKRQRHHKRLERYFIEKKIYQRLEDCETYEMVQQTVLEALEVLEGTLDYPVTIEDVEKLLSIQVKRISRFDMDKSLDELERLEDQIVELEVSLSNVKKYTIRYLKSLLKKYGSAYDRKTEITSFETVQLKEVAKDLEIGWDTKEGFVGSDVEGSETFSCSPFDKLVMFNKNGTYQIIKVPEKLFVGKDILRIDRVDEKLVYNLVYSEGTSRICYTKRFKVEKFILDKEYQLFEPEKGAKILHLSTGEGVVLEALFVPAPRQKVNRALVIFDEQMVKGISARGNRLANKPIQKVKKATGDTDNSQLELLEESTD